MKYKHVVSSFQMIIKIGLLWVLVTAPLSHAQPYASPLIFRDDPAPATPASPDRDPPSSSGVPRFEQQVRQQIERTAREASARDTLSFMQVLGCVLEPSIKLAISSPVAGVISDVPVKRGDVVKKGDVLFKMRAGVEAAAVDLARVKAEFAKRKKNRNQDLYEENLLSPHERDEIETEMRIAEVELQLKREELALRTVFSPVEGVVTDRLFGVGEYVSVDPVVSLATLDPLHVDLLLPSDYFGEIKEGDAIKVYPEAPVKGEYQARVTIVDPLVDPASGTFRVQLLLDNPGLALPAGIRCTVSHPYAEETVTP